MTQHAPTTGREWRLVSRPQGMPVPTDFELVEVEVPPLADGEVLVRNLFLSVDPYMRGRMSDAKSYAAPYELGAPMYGGAVGEVVASTVQGHRVGDLVLHQQAWRDVAHGPAKGFTVVDRTVPPSQYLGALGMPGLTAYAGLFGSLPSPRARRSSCPGRRGLSAAWSVSWPRRAAAPSSAVPARRRRSPG